MTIRLVGEQFGDYRLTRLIGRGGFADVYLGEHYRRKSLAAVKVLNTRLANDNVKSFLNEARSIRLRHPHIVQILDFGLEDDFPFLVMEYAPNGSLRQRHPRGTQLPLDMIVSHVRQISDALQYAHDEGIVHRDIKPDNMLLGRQNEVLLSDFGIASIAHNTQSMNVQDQAGTINYMAPEQLQGKPRPASDQYALGVVVYEWICGERPFQGSFVEIHGQHLSAPPPSLREHVPTLSPAIEEVVMTTLAKDSHRRFPTISAFARAFEQACKPASTGRQVRRVFTPQSHLPKVFADLPTNNPPMHAETIPNKRSPTAPNVDFRSDDNKPPLAHPKNSAFVPARATVSLPEEGSKPYTTKDAVISGIGKRSVSIFRKSNRVWPFAFLIMIVAMLIFGLTVALLGGSGLFVRFIASIATTSTVILTPKSIDLANTFEILAVTGTPDPNKRQMSARIVTATSPAQSKTVTSTGSIPGTRATGLLTFLNNGTSAQSFGSVILTGASGVRVSFNGPITVPAVPPASVRVTGFAVNVGSAGNIGALDIHGSCCASGITVKNGTFSGGRNPQPNPVVQQSDINGAADALAASLIPGTQSALQKQVRPNEQVINNTLHCTKSTFTANHRAGDVAPNVTVTVAITCKEEVYDQQAALTIAANLLKAQASKDLGPHYALTGNIVTAVTKATVVDTRGTVSLLVSAEEVWVYQFSNAVKQDFAKHIVNMSEQDAIKYLKSQPGMSDVKIVISSGTKLPDAANITIEIAPVPGATGTPTVAPGSPGVAPPEL